MILRQPPVAVSVVVPAHNEADNLPLLIEEIVTVLDLTVDAYEVIVVDDASDDATAETLAYASETYPQLVVARMKHRRGQSAALSAGFDLAQGEIIVTMDADLQNDPGDIPRLLAEIPSADVAIGWRRDRKDPISKKVISKIANRARNWLTRECVRDTGCGLKAFRRECVQDIVRFDGMHRFFPTLVKMHGYRVVETPVHHRPRTKGRTHYNIFNRFLRPIADAFAIRWLQQRTLNYELEEETVLVQR